MTNALPPKKPNHLARNPVPWAPSPLPTKKPDQRTGPWYTCEKPKTKPWAKIQKVLQEMTGAKLGGSTLQNHYARTKVNFVVFNKEDVGFYIPWRRITAYIGIGAAACRSEEGD